MSRTPVFMAGFNPEPGHAISTQAVPVIHIIDVSPCQGLSRSDNRHTYNLRPKMYARRSLGDGVDIDHSLVIGSGSFKDVHQGVYTKGPRSNQPCVEKKARPGSVSARELFKNESEIVEKALQYIERFNEEGVWKTDIYLNIPEIWRTRHGEPCVIEPFIRNFEKYNSNSGWVPNSEAHRILAMQALSHFSYHSSGGQFLLCDLQGGVFNKGIALTDPVIMSNKRRFGPTDLGREGMLSFFSRHECNQFCRHHWQKPRGRSNIVKVRSGTSAMGKNGQMIKPRTQVAYDPMAAIYEDDEGTFSEPCMYFLDP